MCITAIPKSLSLLQSSLSPIISPINSESPQVNFTNLFFGTSYVLKIIETYLARCSLCKRSFVKDLLVYVVFCKKVVDVITIKTLNEVCVLLNLKCTISFHKSSNSNIFSQHLMYSKLYKLFWHAVFLCKSSFVKNLLVYVLFCKRVVNVITIKTLI